MWPFALVWYDVKTVSTTTDRREVRALSISFITRSSFQLPLSCATAASSRSEKTEERKTATTQVKPCLKGENPLWEKLSLGTAFH